MGEGKGGGGGEVLLDLADVPSLPVACVDGSSMQSRSAVIDSGLILTRGSEKTKGHHDLSLDKA